MKTYAFWNNKGGTGKTSLNFQTIMTYAEQNTTKKILVLDLCPQANLSELLLGGLNTGSKHLLQVQGLSPRASVGGYFQLRLPNPYSPPQFRSEDFLVQPAEYNSNVPCNISLLAGDPLLELQANAVATLANNQIPGSNTWLNVIDWLKDYIQGLKDFDIVFVDCNPSFSIYTQIALSIADYLILPVMADDSSRRALQNAFSLIYGLHLPSPIYAEHSFAKRLSDAGRNLPKVHTIVKNRLTQYMGAASAYYAVLTSIDKQVQSLIDSNPDFFEFNDVTKTIVEVRDFGTTGVVAFARGMSFLKLNAGSLLINNRRIQIKAEYIKNSQNGINKLVGRL